MTRLPNIVNVADVTEVFQSDGAHWGGGDKALTPLMGMAHGRLGVRLTRVPPRHSACPAHTHAREDEAFYVLSGRGVFRYGDTLQEIGPGDCISCPADTGVAHQLANPFDGEDLCFLAIGGNDRHEVCTYPDSGMVNVCALRQVGYLRVAPYADGEPDRPRILDMAAQRGWGPLG